MPRAHSPEPRATRGVERRSQSPLLSRRITRVTVLAVLWVVSTGAGSRDTRPAPASDELERIQREAFAYFVQQRDAHSGLVFNTTERSAPASPTACGVALSAIPIGIERGWIRRQDGYAQARQLLRALADAQQVRGFFYHFLDARRGTRAWHSEVSVIDSSVAFAGAVVVAAYFPGTEVERLANDLLGRAQWPWFLGEDGRLQWAWRPERGFEGGAMDYSESVLAYLLGLGAPTHPLPPAAWEMMRRPVSRYDDASPAMVYTRDGALFAYLMPLAWFDLRGRHDGYLDYWTNARSAILANMRFCAEHRDAFRTYAAGLWGLSAALGPDGYRAYGATPGVNVHDGTVSPPIVAAAVPWFPDVALQTYRRMEQLAPRLRTPYGLGNALNLDRGYVCRETIALEQGLALLLIENARTGLIWRLFMSHPIAKRAITRAGFVPGALAEPVRPAIMPGNPGDSIAVSRMEEAVVIDADLREWIRREAVELTPRDRRHVESGVFRGADDAAALVYLGWTSRMLYVAGVITDDDLVARARDAKIFEDDCLEVFVDLDRDGFRFDGNPHDRQFGLAPSGPDGRWQLWAWGPLNRVPHEVEAAVRRQDRHVLFELGIPLELLPGVGAQPVRFSVAYHDRDRDGTTGKLHWSIDTASRPGTILFGTLTLQGSAASSPPATTP